jgi:membrane fusion protein (multidrug efflux system)
MTIGNWTWRAAVIAVCGVLAAACGKAPEEEVESESVVEVRTTAATFGDITAVVRATGVVAPAPGADLVVVAPEPARIAEIPRAVGEAVRTGDLLVRFDIPGTRAEVQKQQAEVVRTEAAVRTTRAAETRATELFERGVAARKEVEEGSRAVADAEAALAEARAALSAAEAVAARAEVRATFNGVVAKRQHNPGDLVEASASDLVLRVIDVRRLEIVAAVPLADTTRIAVGAPAHLDGASAPAGELELTVVATPPAIETGAATVPFRLRAAKEIPWPVGTPVQVEIDAERHTHVVLVPRAAIVRDGDDTAVFVARDDKAHRQPVTIGLSDADRVEIVKGISAGDAVIVDGQAGLPDDATIHATAAGEAEPREPADRDRDKGSR